ncbi:hypothetical protein PIB30_096282 [Stylosanthes scabra]|uniref:Uncharacterized protein n=1 Tax=Stylosanthes scabra TaxID=79078 RepID=A0ABU6SWL6_9FABA|nr:hypothetical protein [Stylosanthes scabra]
MHHKNRGVTPSTIATKATGREKGKYPFSLDVLVVELPKKFRYPVEIKPYDGTTYPKHHLDAFENRMLLMNASDAIQCKTFTGLRLVTEFRSLQLTVTEKPTVTVAVTHGVAKGGAFTDRTTENVSKKGEGENSGTRSVTHGCNFREVTGRGGERRSVVRWRTRML